MTGRVSRLTAGHHKDECALIANSDPHPGGIPGREPEKGRSPDGRSQCRDVIGNADCCRDRHLCALGRGAGLADESVTAVVSRASIGSRSSAGDRVFLNFPRTTVAEGTRQWRRPDWALVARRLRVRAASAIAFGCFPGALTENADEFSWLDKSVSAGWTALHDHSLKGQGLSRDTSRRTSVIRAVSKCR